MEPVRKVPGTQHHERYYAQNQELEEEGEFVHNHRIEEAGQCAVALSADVDPQGCGEARRYQQSQNGDIGKDSLVAQQQVDDDHHASDGSERNFRSYQIDVMRCHIFLSKP